MVESKLKMEDNNGETVAKVRLREEKRSGRWLSQVSSFQVRLSAAKGKGRDNFVLPSTPNHFTHVSF